VRSELTDEEITAEVRDYYLGLYWSAARRTEALHRRLARQGGMTVGQSLQLHRLEGLMATYDEAWRGLTHKAG